MANSVEIRNEVVLLHGQVTVLNRSAGPRATFTPIRPDDSLTRRIFHAAGSWAPGGRITQYHWDFGDGHSTTASGNAARFISEHEYAMGSYNVCLSITDDLGRSTTNCVWVETARLSLRHTPAQYQGRPLSAWRACQTTDPIDVEFSVFDEFTPVSDALVRVEGQDYELEGYTNQYGKVAFQIDITNDHARPDGMGRGYMIVRARKDGYLSAPFGTLVFIDCAQLSELVDLGSLRIRDLSERLQKIAELLDSFNPVPPKPFPPLENRLGPFDGRVADVALGLDVLTKLVLLLRQDSDALPVMRLLGLKTTKKRSLSALKERLEQSFSNIERSLDALAEETRRLQEMQERDRQKFAPERRV